MGKERRDFLPPLWPTTLGPWRASHKPPPCLYKGGEAFGAATSSTLAHLHPVTPPPPRVDAWRSSAEISPPSLPPRHCVAGNSSYYFILARWIEEVKVSSSRTCVEREGAVRLAPDREFMGWIVIGSRRCSTISTTFLNASS